MENTDNTLLEMQEQMKQLKEKLETQKIVNERILRKSCNQTVSRLRLKSNLPIVFGFAGILMSASFLELGLSLPFVIATDVMMLVAIAATLLTNRHIPSVDKDMVTAAEELRKYKKIHADWIKFSLPVLAFWLGWLIWQAVTDLGLTGTELFGAISGLTVGIGLGMVIGFKLRRDQLNAADDLLAQLKELKGTGKE